VGAFRSEALTRRTRHELIEAIRQVVKQRKLTQQDAAILCATSQSSLGRLLLGDDRKVSIERMMRWLIELGGSVEIRVDPRIQGVKTWLFSGR
jgi:predicted XRE-type DNA-binding protein